MWTQSKSVKQSYVGGGKRDHDKCTSWRKWIACFQNQQRIGTGCENLVYTQFENGSKVLKFI